MATRENLADDFLRCELACRHTACIGQQRKLEFASELQRMPPGRLPAQVARCNWGKNPVVRGRARPKMHTDVVKHIAAQVGQHPDQAAVTEEMSAAAFKADVKTAVLTTEMKRADPPSSPTTFRSPTTARSALGALLLCVMRHVASTTTAHLNVSLACMASLGYALSPTASHVCSHSWSGVVPGF